MRRTAVVTGADSRIGRASARVLARADFDVVMGVRHIGDVRSPGDYGRLVELDVTSDDSVRVFAEQLSVVDVLVTTAGGSQAWGYAPDVNVDDWRWLWETSVLDVLRVTRALIPSLERSDNGTVVAVSSVPASVSGSGPDTRSSTAHPTQALHRMLSAELSHTSIRFTEVSPATDSFVAMAAADGRDVSGPAQRAVPLSATDVADVVAFAATMPPRVSLERMVFRPGVAEQWMDLHRG